MWLVTLLLLVALGLLGIADWLKAQRPDTARHIAPLEQATGWVGVAGLIWGLLVFLRWLAALGPFYATSGAMLVRLIMSLVMIALSLILAMPQLRQLFGSSEFIERLQRFADRLATYRIGLGFACLLLALYSLLARAL